MENNRVWSAFIGWLGSYGIPYGEKQIGDLQPERLGRYYDPKVSKRLGASWSFRSGELIFGEKEKSGRT